MPVKRLKAGNGDGIVIKNPFVQDADEKFEESEEE